MSLPPNVLANVKQVVATTKPKIAAIMEELNKASNAGIDVSDLRKQVVSHQEAIRKLESQYGK